MKSYDLERYCCYCYILITYTNSDFRFLYWLLCVVREISLLYCNVLTRCDRASMNTTFYKQTVSSIQLGRYMSEAVGKLTHLVFSVPLLSFVFRNEWEIINNCLKIVWWLKKAPVKEVLRLIDQDKVSLKSHGTNSSPYDNKPTNARTVNNTWVRIIDETKWNKLYFDPDLVKYIGLKLCSSIKKCQIQIKKL